MTRNGTRLFFLAMGSYWLVFGLITTVYPALMDLFQTREGVTAGTAFSDHVWRHGGLDIIAFVTLLFALSLEERSRRMVMAAAIAALLPTGIIFYSYFATPYWNPLFLVAGAGCLAFAAWGFVLATDSRRRRSHAPVQAEAHPESRPLPARSGGRYAEHGRGHA